MAALRTTTLRLLLRSASRSAYRESVRALSTYSIAGRNPLTSEGFGNGRKILPSEFTKLWVRTRVSGSNAGSNYSPLSGSNWGDKPPEEIGPLFPGCDYEHWLIVMDPPNDGKATKDEMVEVYIQTLAKVLGSEEEAKKVMYNVSCDKYYGFGCQISEETSYKLKDLPGVVFVLPDSYVDPTNRDYGGELLIDGKIVPRTPERQRLIDAATQHTNTRPRYNDRIRSRRRENMGR